MTNDRTSDTSGARSGSVVGERYEIGDLLGRSAMAETYKATDRTLGATVALKFLSGQLAEDTAFAEQFVNTAMEASQIKHPNVLAVLDAGTADGNPYFVQEYDDGQTLMEKLKREGKLDPSAASEIAEKVLAALSVAHEAGLYHRDINPGNILVTESGEVKLMDLGMARVESPHTVAQARAIMGTAAYLSPEQAQGEVVDGRSDIYSLAIVLYEMLTGKPPFSAESPVAVAYMHVRDTPTPVGDLAADAPPAMAQAIMKALAKKPADRFQTAESFRGTLAKARTGEPAGDDQASAIARGIGSEMVIFGTPAAPSGGLRQLSRRTKIIAGFVVGILLLVGGYLLFFQPRSSEVPDFTGVTLAQAQQALDQLGLKWRVLDQESAEAVAGTVIDQAPDPNTVVPKDVTVLLTVARAPSTTPVPSVAGLSQSEAETQLIAAGLTLGTITEETSEEATVGTILAQDPLAGTVVPGGTPVNLTVGVTGGPSLVPNLSCYTPNNAAIELNDAGLKMTIVGVEALGPEDVCPTNGIRISRQSPAAGSEAAKGEIVSVWTSTAMPSESPAAPSVGASSPPPALPSGSPGPKTIP
jgi:serine/threonine-protein kinase